MVRLLLQLMREGWRRQCHGKAPPDEIAEAGMKLLLARSAEEQGRMMCEQGHRRLDFEACSLSCAQGEWSNFLLGGQAQDP